MRGLMINGLRRAGPAAMPVGLTTALKGQARAGKAPLSQPERFGGL